MAARPCGVWLGRQRRRSREPTLAHDSGSSLGRCPPPVCRSGRRASRAALALALALTAGALPAAAREPGAATTEPPAAASPPEPAASTREARPTEPGAPIEIRVPAGPRPRSGRDATAATTVHRREELTRPGATVAEVIADGPGVQIRRAGSDSELATASLRGATAAQTPVYLAGVRLNDDVTGTADLSTVPPTLLHRIEVYRGSAPLEADRLGIGGAIFLEPLLPSRPQARAGALAGSYGATGAWLAASAGDARAAALFALRRDAASNDFSYVNDAGTRFTSDDDRRVTRANADHRTWDLWAIGRATLGGRARTTLVYDGFAREQGITGLSVVPAAQSRARVDRQLVAATTVLPCGRARDAGDEGCRVELSTSGLAARTFLDDPAEELALGATSVATEGRRVGQQARWRQRIGHGVTLTASAEQSAETLSSVRAGAGASGTALAARRVVTRPVASVAYAPVPAFEALALLALDRHQTAGPSTSAAPALVAPSGRFGLLARPAPALTLLANAGRAVRLPTLGELYGTAPLVRGNPGLEPEVGTSVDLGLRAEGALRRLGLTGRLEAFAYRRRVERLVSYRQSFRQLIPYNLGAARIRGLELAGELRQGKRLQLGSVATLEDPRDVSGERTVSNDLLPLHARLVLVETLDVGTAPGIPGVARVGLGARLRHRSSRYQDPAGLVVIPHQTTVDLEANARLLGERLALRVAVENLLDASEWDWIGLPLPGRTVNGSLEVTLP